MVSSVPTSCSELVDGGSVTRQFLWVNSACAICVPDGSTIFRRASASCSRSDVTADVVPPKTPAAARSAADRARRIQSDHGGTSQIVSSRSSHRSRMQGPLPGSWAALWSRHCRMQQCVERWPYLHRISARIVVFLLRPIPRDLGSMMYYSMSVCRA